MTSDWLPLTLDPRALGAERQQIHHAALVLASIAHSLLPHADDDSHTNFAVDDDGSALRPHPLGGPSKSHCSLALAPLELRWHGGGAVDASFALVGRTPADALAWADAEARRRGHRGVARRDYDEMPEHPLLHGAKFAAGDAAARAELGRWFANGARLFAELAVAEPPLSPVRVWPHHFDLGALLPLDGGVDGATIGVGLSPGDGSYDEPYFYATPYPLPDRALPPLRGPGVWHTEDFTSVVATGTLLRKDGTPQRDARAWLRSALAAGRQALRA